MKKKILASNGTGAYVQQNLEVLPDASAATLGQVATITAGGTVAFIDPFLKTGGTIDGALIATNFKLPNAANPSLYDTGSDNIYLNARVIQNKSANYQDGLYIGFNNNNNIGNRIYDGGGTNFLNIASSTLSTVGLVKFLFGNQTDDGTFAQFSGDVKFKGNTVINGTSNFTGLLTQGTTGGYRFIIDGGNGGGPQLNLVDGASNSFFKIGAYAGVSNFDSYQNRDIVFSTGAGTTTAKFRLFASGNLSLQNGGTFTDNGYRLDVNGSGRFNGSVTMSNLILAATSNGFIQNSGFVMNPSVYPIFRPYNITGYDFCLNNSTSVIRINTTGNVGIGTTIDSGYKLDVSGTSRFSGAVIFDGRITTADIITSRFVMNGNTARSAGESVLGLRHQFLPYTNTDGNPGSVTTPHLTSTGFGRPTFAATNATQTYTNASTIYIDGSPLAGANAIISNSYSLYVASGNSYFGGNVGIGVIPTSSKLDIYTLGTANALQLRAGNPSGSYSSNQILFGFDGTNNYNHSIKTRHNSNQLSDNAIDFYLWNKAVDSFSTIGTYNAMTLSLLGVGIGTSNPVSNLTIQSTATVGNKVVMNLNNPYAYGTGIGLATTVLRFNRTPTDAGSTGVMADIYAGNENETTSLYGYLAFATRDGNSEITTERMRIRSNGNVGIGTITPLAKLEVRNNTTLGNTTGSISEIARFATTCSNESIIKIANFRFAAGTNWETACTRIRHTVDATDMGYIEFNPNGGAYGLALGGYSGEIMRLLDSGRVGIGTTAPTSKLDVNGDINTSGALNLNGANFAYWDGSYQRIYKRNAVPALSISNTQTYYDNNTHYFRTETGINLAQIDGNGISTPFSIKGAKVIIGSSTDNGNALQVTGYANITSFLGLGENLGMNNGNFQYWKDTAGNYIRLMGLSANNMMFGDVDNNLSNSANLFYAQNAHLFYTNGTEKLRIIQNGNVGIGTQTPTKKLEVNGSIGISGAVTTPIRTITGATGTYAILDNDHVVLIDTSPGCVFNVESPSASNIGREIVLVNKSIGTQYLSQNYINSSRQSTNELPYDKTTRLKYDGTNLQQI